MSTAKLPPCAPVRGLWGNIVERIAAGAVRSWELAWATDRRRLVLGSEVIGPAVHLGTVASESAMLALSATHERGCYPGDMCRRSDLGKTMLCIGGNGTTAAQWVEL